MIINEKLLLESKITQKPGNIVSDMDGEKVMLNIANGKYYNLGEIGGFIWELIEEPIALQTIVTEMIRIYEVEQDDCEQQILSFSTALYSEGLIENVS